MGNLPGLLLIVVPLWLACQKAPAPAAPLQGLTLTYGPRTPSDGVVAKVNGWPIYQSDVKRQAEAERVSRREALDTLINIELLANLAASRPWSAGGSQAQDGFRQSLAQTFVTKEIEPSLDVDDIPESLLKQAYERTITAYVHPRLVQVAILQFNLPIKSKPERRAEARAWAQELAAWIARPQNRSFEAWQRLSHESLWQQRQVNFGTSLVPEGEAFSEEFNRAIHRMKNPGEVTVMVEDPTGFHAALYLGERAARNLAFEEAKGTIRKAIYDPWRRRRFLELTDELARKASVQVAVTTPVQDK